MKDVARCFSTADSGKDEDVMFALKGTFLLAATAVAELGASGEYWIAVLAIPTLVSLWYAIRLRARRRARESVRA